MYKVIGKHPGTRKLYGDKLVAQGRPAADGPDAMVKATAPHWTRARTPYDPVLTNYKSKYAVDWAPSWARSGRRRRHALPLAEIKRLAERHHPLPATSSCIPLVGEGARRPCAMGVARSGRWGMGETWLRVARGERLRVRSRARTRGHVHAPARGAARPEREKWDEGTYTRCKHIAEARRRSW
jgi:2-oxoglutarate dehydrogenase E1 component